MRAMTFLGFALVGSVTAGTIYLLSRLSAEATTLLIGVLFVAVAGAIVGAPIVALAYLITRRDRGAAPGRQAERDPMLEMMRRDYEERKYRLLAAKLDQQEQRLALPSGQAAPEWTPDTLDATRQPNTTNASRRYVVLGDDDNG